MANNFNVRLQYPLIRVILITNNPKAKHLIAHSNFYLRIKYAYIILGHKLLLN